MFGRLPWLAFERRMRALRFLVFFDIGNETIGEWPRPHRGLDRAPEVIARGIGLPILTGVGTHIRRALILPGLAKLSRLTPHWRHRPHRTARVRT